MILPFSLSCSTTCSRLFLGAVISCYASVQAFSSFPARLPTKAVGTFAASAAVGGVTASATNSLVAGATRHSKQSLLMKMSTSSSFEGYQQLPELVVFDLDACFWDQEMYEMPALPDQEVKGELNGRGVGVKGVMSGSNQISMHKGSLLAMQQHADGKFGEMKVCFASSADTPFAEKIGRASLKMLEVLPGLTVWDLVVGRDWGGNDVNQIGRQPPLSSNKSTSHFPRIRELTGIRYDRMLFFDDCIWGE